jgi:hypothetical protein
MESLQVLNAVEQGWMGTLEIADYPGVTRQRVARPVVVPSAADGAGLDIAVVQTLLISSMSALENQRAKGSSIATIT